MRPKQIFVVATLCCLIALQSLAASPRYAITQLRQFASASNEYSSAISINDEGVIVGEAPISNLIKPVIWSADNQISELSLPAGMARGIALNISQNGFVVGHATTSSNPTKTYPVMYAPNGSTLLSPSGTNPYASVYDVENNGVTLIGQPGSLSLLTTTATTRLNTTGLSIPFDTGSYGITTGFAAMNEAGMIVATASVRVNNVDRVSPYIIRANAPPQRLVTDSRDSAVCDINGSGTAIGTVTEPGIFNPKQAAAVFRDGQIITPTLPTAVVQSGLIAINDRSQFIGYAQIGFRSAALVGDGNELRELDSLIPVNSGWTLYRVEDINNRGQIIGVGNQGNFRLDPIRKPGDTNYDNTVNYADVLTLVQNYNRSGNGNVFYETGDFNYDWVINAADRLTMSQNYYDPALFESDWARAVTTIPEPASLALLSAPMLIRRRR